MSCATSHNDNQSRSPRREKFLAHAAHAAGSRCAAWGQGARAGASFLFAGDFAAHKVADDGVKLTADLVPADRDRVHAELWQHS